MQYNPERVPDDSEELRIFLFNEFNRLAQVLSAIQNVQLVELHNPPDKPRTGMVVLADGTNWNPGSGAGFYGFRGGAWQFLG